MGIDESAYRRWTPRHAVISVSPFGLTGPRSQWAASELTLQAASGLMFLTGEADQRPQQLAPYQAELTGGVVASAVALASLRVEGSEAVRADLSIQETMAAHTYQAVGPYVHYGEVARREQRIKAGLRMVPTSDGYVYCAPGAVASMRVDGIAVLLDEPRLAEERFQTAEGRMQNWDEFFELFVPPFRARTAQEWFEAAESMHMTFALVQTIDDLFACPQLDDRGFLHRSGQSPDALAQPIRAFGGSLPATEPTPAPRTPGQDSKQTLKEWLGW
jgi:crotonobetainyl-CoA:carnitine CoA-transferase CaiB-like acyl-CoA transferase